MTVDILFLVTQNIAMNVVKGKKITGFVVNICRCFKYNRHRSVALAYKARKLTLYYINNVDKILDINSEVKNIHIRYMHFRTTYDPKTSQTISSGVKV